MYAVTLKNPEKDTLQMRHGNEQELGYLWGLPAQNDFP